MTMANPGDRDLGMDRPIIRRDFLNGVGLALTGSLAYPWFEALGQPAAFAPEKAPGYYPPAKMGLRGSHDGFLGGRPRAARWEDLAHRDRRPR